MTSHGVPSTRVLGGGVMNAEAYAAFLGQEYLASYLSAGGGSVKLAVTGNADVAERFERTLRAAANEQHCQLVSLSAETTKAHMIDQVFIAVARQIDWQQVAAAVVQTAYDDIAVPAASGRLTVAEVAADHD
ncbi:MAG: hypothetical protein ACR2P2_18105, partial [Nakamurella sp.]